MFSKTLVIFTSFNSSEKLVDIKEKQSFIFSLTYLKSHKTQIIDKTLRLLQDML